MRSHYYRPVTVRVGDAAEFRDDATIRVLRPGTTTPISDPIYSSRTGGGTHPQGWAADEAVIDFYLETPQWVRIGVTRGGVESFIDDQEVGSVNPWERTLRDYGAMADGTTVDSGAIAEAIGDMSEGSSLRATDGVYLIDEPIQRPTVDGSAFWCPPGGAVFKAKNGSDLPAIMASQEWLTNGEEPLNKDAKRSLISGLVLWGGGFAIDSDHDDEIETTANAEYGLVVHGNNCKVKDVLVVSTNSHGVLFAGTGMDGTTVISESHENGISDPTVRFTGGDGMHFEPGYQDTWVKTAKVQNCGGHGIFTDLNCPGLSFLDCHPSWAAKDLMHFESGWGYRIIGNYIGGLGRFMDGEGIAAIHYGIYIDGDAQIIGNSINDFPPQTVLVDDIVGMRLNYGARPMIVKDNRFYADTAWDGSDSTHGLATLFETHGSVGASIVADNLFVRT